MSRVAGVWLVTDVYPPGCGGSGWSTHALARTLVDHGHDVEVVSLDPCADGVAQRVFGGVRVSELGVRKARRNPLRRMGARDYACADLEEYLVARLADAPDVNVVHAQHLHSGPPAIAAARRCGRASVVTLRDYWPVCLHGTSWWKGAECSGCTTVNLSGCMGEYWRWPKPLPRLMVPWARRRLRARQSGVEPASRIVTVSEWVRQRIEPELPGRYEVLPNIVDGEDARRVAAAAPPIDGLPQGPYLAAAGKLIRTKGFDRMLEDLAAAGCTMPLVIAGAGEQRVALEAQAARLQLDVTFTGWIAHGAVLSVIKEARGLLLPGAWNEPMSRLLLEATALGTPVVAWPSGGNPEPLTDGGDGFIVDSPVKLAAALAALQDEEVRARLAAAAQRMSAERFSPARQYPRILAIYEGALDASAPARDPR